MIQPGGGIVTAGWRSTPAGNDFALTRHDATGQPRPRASARTGSAPPIWAATTTRPTTPRCTPDGGIVAVGRTDAAGFTKLDFGIVRYTPDGTPDQGFGAAGIVRTDVLGGGDQANAVAVQPDGKIVVAGFATRNGIDSDFARRPLRPGRQPRRRLRRERRRDHRPRHQSGRRPGRRHPARRPDRRRRHRRRGRRARALPAGRHARLRLRDRAARRSPTSAPRTSPTASPSPRAARS